MGLLLWITSTRVKDTFYRVYDFQRALCEDSKLIGTWFELVRNIKAKYGILDYDFYNFDKTGFIIGQIYLGIVVTQAN